MESQLKQEVRFLTTKLGLLIREQEGDRIFRKIERFRKLAKMIRESSNNRPIRVKDRLVGGLPVLEAYHIVHAFALFFHLVNLCEERTRVRHLQNSKNPPQSLGHLFSELKAAGVTAKRLQQCLDELEIQPVLTAHPTEAKRRSMLNHILRLNAQFNEPDEILEALWQTRPIRHHRMNPLNEVTNTLFFFEHTIFDTIFNFYKTFDRELAAHYPAIRRKRPFLKFASWVGGDRDGHPFVTADVSLHTMKQQRAMIIEFYDQQCKQLIAELSHSEGDLTSRRDSAEPKEEHFFQPFEIFRQRLAVIRSKLAHSAKGYRDSKEFVADLEEIQKMLRRQKAWRAATGRLDRLITQARVFGFHLAELDFRDNTEKLAGDGHEFEGECKTMRDLQEEHGTLASDRFILSMTHSANDVRRFLQLARRAGLKSVDVIPLFETIDDLKKSGDIIRELWNDRHYRRHLASRSNIQEIMLGYSDSNKSGGYLAANWFLYRTQQQLVRLAKQKGGIKLRFFHGMGGSIDRGGGASYRSLRAHSYAAHGSRIRITEQGEVIALKYSSPAIAQRNLEQLTSAVIATNCIPPHSDRSKLAQWETWMEELAQLSLKCYRKLVFETPEFHEYFRQATPIDLIEDLRIGSRPSRRSSSADINQLRAIPWVFAWTQSRHLLSAWYGLGSALQTFAQSHPEGLETLCKMYRSWPYFASLMENAEMSLAKTDLFIARQYADLVHQKAVRQKIYGLIEEEYHRSVKMLLNVCNRKKLLENQPVLAESIGLRNPYIDPLNYIQIEFLSRWRRTPPVANREAIHELLALTINGIAFGMKSTG